MALIFTKQIDPTSLSLFVQQAASGSAFSGNLIAYVSASGWLGNAVVDTTGGSQLIIGTKTFATSPFLPYSGSTGSAPSTLFVLDKDLALSGVLTGQLNYTPAIASASGALNTQITYESGLAATGLSNLTTYATTGLAALSAVRVTGSSIISTANFTGLGGTLIIYSGNQVFVSGAAGGGGSNTSVTGSSAITAPNFTGAGNVTLTYDGTYVTVSGVASVGGVPNTVTTTGAYVLAGGYTFSGSPFVPNPTAPSGAVNYFTLSGISGVLQSGINLITGLAQGPSGATGPSGAQGPIGNFILSGITGNFVNMAFWYDQYNLATGLNTIEAFVGRSFFFTGYGIGAINSGTQGYFSGSFYQRTPQNTKTPFMDLSLNSGLYFKSSGGFSQEISGLNRVGVDIYLLGTGITGLSLGLFGVGY